MQSYRVCSTSQSRCVSDKNLCEGDSEYGEVQGWNSSILSSTHFNNRGEITLNACLCAISKNEYLKDCKGNSRTIISEGSNIQSNMSLGQRTILMIFEIVHKLKEPYKDGFA